MNTVEIIKELVPLLQGAGEGVFVLALFLVIEPYFNALLLLAGFCFAWLQIVRSANRFLPKNRVINALIEMHDLEQERKNQHHKKIRFFSSENGDDKVLVRWIAEAYRE